MEPELWTRCPEAVIIASDTDPTWWCDCHGSGCNTLVRVPFDEVEARGGPIRPDEIANEARVLLRAALGEGTKP